MGGEPTAVDVVRGFAGLRALVIGDAMLDSYLEGVANPPLQGRAGAGGPPGLGRASPGWCRERRRQPRLPRRRCPIRRPGRPDDAGAALRAALRERGVDDRWLVEDPAVSTIHKQRIVANDQYVVRFDEGDTLGVSPEARSRVLAAVEDGFAACDLVVASDYGYGVLSDDVIDRLRTLREKLPRVLAVDAKEIGRFASARATVVTPNLNEARLAIDPVPISTPLHGRRRRGDRPPSPRQARRRQRRRHDGRRRSRPDRVRRPSDPSADLPVARAGDVGAGDTFTAAMALALASGASPHLAARIGMDAAAIAITQRRTSVVAHQELLRRASLDAQKLPVELRELVARLDGERWGGRTIVFTNGVFDILHAGHVQLLKRAKRLGDILVVGVNSDASTRRLKGPTRPINREADRLALVAALDPVDYAVLFEDDTPEATIRAVRAARPRQGRRLHPELLPEREVCEEVGARIEILSLVGGPIDHGRDRQDRLPRPRRRARGNTVIDRCWAGVRRLLVVRLDNLGDVLVTTPAIRALRRSLPRPISPCSPVHRGRRRAG
jgi:D-beta-D-heptose 7-phosphate kinase/D-beta-D-heptose 1-phosphate adenosyltransferase